MAQLDIVVDRLDRLRRSGANSFSARCPSHDDRSNSLSVRGVQDRVLIYCHAGCRTADVVDALGLGLRDLFEE